MTNPRPCHIAGWNPASSSSPVIMRARCAKSPRLLAHRTGSSRCRQASLDIPEPEETGTSFAANAELKARFSADLSGMVALADDSGLCVDALNGDPGVYTANWAETPDGRDWDMAMRKVEDALGAKGPEAGRDAHFVCVLSLCWPDGHVESFEGRVEGSMIWPPRGTRGFGYDPVFMPIGYDTSFAELDPEVKHSISHRADAFRKLAEAVLPTAL
jgi:XTP/dITP diphosphohydrolase